MPGALDLVAEYHPKGAQPVYAPDEVDETADPAEEFLAYACLRHGGDDSPQRWERASRLLAAASIHVAAAAADESALRAHLAADPARASQAGGPYGWEPLLYLAFARHDPHISEEASLGTAGALLGFALAELLLTAGADASDSQALYNRQFGEDNRHLLLLFAHGLGRGDGGPWAARFGPAADSPQEMLRSQLWRAIVHDMRDRVRLLIEHRVDFLTPYSAPGGRPMVLRNSDGYTPAIRASGASLAGHRWRLPGARADRTWPSCSSR